MILAVLLRKRYGAKTLPRLYVVDKYRTIRLAKKVLTRVRTLRESLYPSSMNY